MFVAICYGHPRKLICQMEIEEAFPQGIIHQGEKVRASGLGPLPSGGADLRQEHSCGKPRTATVRNVGAVSLALLLWVRAAPSHSPSLFAPGGGSGLVRKASCMTICLKMVPSSTQERTFKNMW